MYVVALTILACWLVAFLPEWLGLRRGASALGAFAGLVLALWVVLA